MNLMQTDTKAGGAGAEEWLAATKDMIFTIHNSSPYPWDSINRRLEKAEADVVAGRVLGPFDNAEEALEAMQKRGRERSHY